MIYTDESYALEVPESITAFSLIQHLDLYAGDYSITLPDLFSTLTLGNLADLRCLDIDSIALESLPWSIGNLKNLKDLKSRHCRDFSPLPESIGNLKSLERLIVENCSLTVLPETIEQLHALKELEITYCGEVLTIPGSFADFVLGYPSQRCSLTRVKFWGCKVLLLHGRSKQALKILEERVVYSHWKAPSDHGIIFD